MCFVRMFAAGSNHLPLSPVSRDIRAPGERPLATGPLPVSESAMERRRKVWGNPNVAAKTKKCRVFFMLFLLV